MDPITETRALLQAVEGALKLLDGKHHLPRSGYLTARQIQVFCDGEARHLPSGVMSRALVLAGLTPSARFRLPLASVWKAKPELARVAASLAEELAVLEQQQRQQQQTVLAMRDALGKSRK